MFDRLLTALLTGRHRVLVELRGGPLNGTVEELPADLLFLPAGWQVPGPGEASGPLAGRPRHGSWWYRLDDLHEHADGSCCAGIYVWEVAP